MAKKKRVTRVKSRSSRKIAHRKAPVHNKRYKPSSTMSDKIKLVLNNLLLFVALSLVSFVLYRFVQNNFLNDLFFIIAIVFGFIGVGFLIVLLILFVLRLISKRR